jgi:phage-related protein
MIERLGTVIYWIGCIIAALTAAFGVLIYVYEGFGRKDGPVVTGFILLTAFVIWLAG